MKAEVGVGAGFGVSKIQSLGCRAVGWGKLGATSSRQKKKNPRNSEIPGMAGPWLLSPVLSPDGNSSTGGSSHSSILAIAQRKNKQKL